MKYRHHPSKIVFRLRSGLRALFALLAAVAMTTLAAPSVIAAPQDQQPSFLPLETPAEFANKMVVLGLFDALNSGNLSVINLVAHPDLIQHQPEIANGSAALRAYETGLRTRYPDLRFDIKRVIVEGDLVLVHSNFVPRPGDLGLAEADIFRLQQGTIAEQWELTQSVPPSTGVGNDMFSTLSSPQVNWPTPVSTAASSKQASYGVFADAINQPKKSPRDKALEHYIGDNPYFQHYPGVPNGIAGVKQFLDGVWTHPAYRADVQMTFGEGDLAIVFVHLFDLDTNAPDDRGWVSADMFRVSDNKLLEHWSVQQTVPATSANNNPMY